MKLFQFYLIDSRVFLSTQCNQIYLKRSIYMLLMGKSKKNIVSTPTPYTESERNIKWTSIKIQLAQLNLEHVLRDEDKIGINNFIKKGQDYVTTLDLPVYSRVMEINFYNDKKKKTGINLKFNKIRVMGESDDNPINKLNKIQEEIAQAQLLNN